MNVTDILSAAHGHLVTISNGAQLVQAASLLGGGRVDLVVVCDDAGKMVGVVTRTDIVSRISVCSGHACLASVASVMSRDVTYCRPADTLEIVWDRRKEQRRVHIPIVDQDEHPLGMLRARDGRQALRTGSKNEEGLLRDYVMGIGYR